MTTDARYPIGKFDAAQYPRAEAIAELKLKMVERQI